MTYFALENDPLGILILAGVLVHVAKGALMLEPVCGISPGRLVSCAYLSRVESDSTLSWGLALGAGRAMAVG